MAQTALDLFPTEEVENEDFIEQIKKFNRIGLPTTVATEAGLTYFVNDFWTAQQRQSNSIHEISYRACFKAQLPEFFVLRLTEAGQAVYDPFMGRGTTPLQASLMGRRPIGNDINPLSILLTRPRLMPPTLVEVARRLETVAWERPSIQNEDLLAFYYPETLQKIEALRSWLLQREVAGELDHVDDWIRMVALNRLTGHSPGFFSVYTLPPNQAVSVESQKKINLARNQTPPRRDVKSIIIKKSRSLLSDEPRLSSHEPVLGTAPAWATPYIRDSSVDLIVTSPPFLDVVQYAADNWLRCWFAGIEPENVPISMHKTPEAWMMFVRDCFGEFARIVRPSGHVAFEVGEVRNGKVLLERCVSEAVTGLPFETVGVLVNQQEFTKTSNCWGVSNNSKGTNSNRIVLLKRH